MKTSDAKVNILFASIYKNKNAAILCWKTLYSTCWPIIIPFTYAPTCHRMLQSFPLEADSRWDSQEFPSFHTPRKIIIVFTKPRHWANPETAEPSPSLRNLFSEINFNIILSSGPRSSWLAWFHDHLSPLSVLRTFFHLMKFSNENFACIHFPLACTFQTYWIHRPKNVT
jgi:hypothetical protein